LEVTFRSCGMAPRLPPSKPGYDREPVSQVAAEAECSQAKVNRMEGGTQEYRL
jgi:hypothetical protein